MEKCRFKPGDRVDINVKTAMSETEFKRSLAGMKLRDVIFGPRTIDGWAVIFRNFDKRLQQWLVWIESPAGEVQRFEERLLLDRPENFTPTRSAIQEGKTAREILGLPGEPRPECKKYYRVVFREKK